MKQQEIPTYSFTVRSVVMSWVSVSGSFEKIEHDKTKSVPFSITDEDVMINSSNCWNHLVTISFKRSFKTLNLSHFCKKYIQCSPHFIIIFLNTLLRVTLFNKRLCSLCKNSFYHKTRHRKLERLLQC